jgi:hypothetical protein
MSAKANKRNRPMSTIDYLEEVSANLSETIYGSTKSSASKGDTDAEKARNEGKMSVKGVLKRVAAIGGQAAVNYALDLRCVRTNDWTSRGNEALVGVVEPTGSEDWLAFLHPAGFVLMAGFGQWQRIAVATVGGEP